MDYSNKNYYEILGVDKNADIDNIKKAMNRLKFENSDYNSTLYSIIDKAYETLSNPSLREEYNKSLEQNIAENDYDMKIYEPIHSNNDIYEKISKIETLEKLKAEYKKSIDKISELYDSEIDEVMINGRGKYGSNLPTKIKNYTDELGIAFNLNNQIEKLCKELSIKSEIRNIDDIIQTFHQRELTRLRFDSLKIAEENYEQSLEAIKQFYNKEDFNERDKEWDKLLLNAFNYYSQINTISKKLGVKVDVVNGDEFLRNLKSLKENKKTKLPQNVIQNPHVTRNYVQDQLKKLVDNYEQTINKIITINNKNLNSEEKDYSEWKPSLQTAYRAYDELVNFCEKNNINKDFETVDEKLAKYNISKEIPENQKSKSIDLGKHKNNVTINPNIYENAKYVQNNKLNSNKYEVLQEMYEFNKKVSRVKLTTIGAGLGFVLLISPIGGFGILGSTIGAVAFGKLFNSIVKKKQEKKQFVLTKESYTGKITEINTIESQIIHNSNELLKKEIEDLAKHPNSDFRLQVAKQKYLNQVDILEQIINVRQNAKSKKGGFTSDSLKIAALKQEYRQAKHNLSIQNKKIKRKELENNPYSENLNLNSIRYKNLTIGNMLLKRDIKKMKLKLQKEAFNKFINEEESTKTR